MELKRYLEIINRRKYLLISIVGLAMAVALTGPLLYQMLYGRVYYIPLRIQVNKQDFGAQMIANAPADLGKFFSDNYFRNVFAIAKSEPVTQRVIDRMGLKNSKGKAYSPLRFLDPGIGQVMSEQKGVKLKPLTETEIIEIWGISKDPQEAAQIANVYSEELGRELSRMNQELGTNLVNYYQTEIPRLKKDLSQSESDVLQYRLKNHISDIDSYRSQLLTSLVTLENSIQATDRSLKENTQQRQSTLAQIKKQPELRLDSRTYSTNPQLQSIRQSLLEQERNLAAQLQIYTEEYPDVKASQNRIDTLRRQLKQEVEKTFSQEQFSRNSYLNSLLGNLGDAEINEAVFKARLGILSQQKADIVKKLDELSAKELEYKRLTRKMDSLQQRLSSCYTQLEAAQGIKGSHISNISVLTPVTIPTDKSTLNSYTYFPQKKKILFITLVLSLGAGLVFIFLVDYLQGKAFSEEEFKTASGLPVICKIPRLDSNFEPFTKEEKQCLKEIVADWTLRRKTGVSNVICLLSPQPSDGRTSAALAIAKAFQSAGKKAAIITYTGSPSKEMITRSGLEYREMDPDLAIDPDKLQNWLAEQGAHNDALIIDPPSLEVSRLGLHLAKVAGVAYLVCRSGKTKRDAVSRMGAVLDDYKLKAQGILLNQYSG
jgi:uncharacterized protein involved in exopolysaccharide biosynthesis